MTQASIDPDAPASDLAEKLNIQVGDIVVISLTSRRWPLKKVAEYASELVDTIGPVQVIVVPFGLTLEKMDEDLMAKAGWVRAAT